ncbi:type II toxin-antitoxin system RelB/DinJ family antitoxin [Clostridium minihomine]|uniref:type II toxin-antitoxin system RelB/DinJ family antitoxin n=1 Tax=Clostridium minihomine TaxID=2045012 RepID=UPI000C77A93B|nr:type II toxin-antitoxin system RelB/DinJ family antitoxin [Clostridium minihomine]
MAQQMVSFYMDEDLKKMMENMCYEMGMSMEDAFTIFAKKVTREKRIPFEVSIDPWYGIEAFINNKQGVAHDIIEIESE